LFVGFLFSVGGFRQPLDGVEATVLPGRQVSQGPGGLVEPAVVDPEEDVATLFAPADQAGGLEHPQVLRNGLPGERDLPGQVRMGCATASCT
jgi:hypothetical protein